MTLIVRLSGNQIRHNGKRVGCHGRLDSGQKVFLAHSDLFYSETAFTLSKGVLNKMDDNVSRIAFKDSSGDLTLFASEHFFRVLEGNEDKDHYILQPEDYHHDDKQVAVSAWESLNVYHNMNEEYKIDGGKYSEMENL